MIDNRYEIRYGKWGCFHYDTQNSVDLTLEDATRLLNGVNTTKDDRISELQAELTHLKEENKTITKDLTFINKHYLELKEENEKLQKALIVVPATDGSFRDVVKDNQKLKADLEVKEIELERLAIENKVFRINADPIGVETGVGKALQLSGLVQRLQFKLSTYRQALKEVEGKLKVISLSMEEWVKLNAYDALSTITKLLEEKG